MLSEAVLILWLKKHFTVRLRTLTVNEWIYCVRQYTWLDSPPTQTTGLLASFHRTTLFFPFFSLLIFSQHLFYKKVSFVMVSNSPCIDKAQIFNCVVKFPAIFFKKYVLCQHTNWKMWIYMVALLPPCVKNDKFYGFW